MPFTFKLARRLARVRRPLVACVVLAVACEQPITTSNSDARVTSVIVTPDTLTLDPSGSRQFAAYGRTGAGDSVAVSVTWSASAGTITPAGLYTAGSSAGSFRVVATDANTGLADTSTVTVASVPPPPPPPSKPGTPTDLAVTAVTESSATLAFTEVNNGTGQPADYGIRYAAGTISWGSATSVSSGTCATPVVGTAIGAHRSCTVQGLAAATAYQFQLVAFRGTPNVNAVYGDLSNVASTTTAGTPPPPPPPGTWPNEPAGMTLVAEEPFNSLIEGGWSVVQRQTTNGSGVSVMSDATAPASPSSVLAFKYAAGYEAGSEPGAEYFPLGSRPVTETFVGFWWKASNPWQFHPSGVNKVAFLFSPVDNMYIMMYNPGSGPTIQVETQLVNDVRRLPPNVTATPVTLGVWHQIEWYVKYSTTASSRDGIVRWWVDGVLQGVYTDLQMPADGGFVEYTIAPTWGGVGGTKSQTDYYWYDQYHISRR